MKKLLLSVSLFAFCMGFAQTQISFESSEGYSLGEINTQNGWDLLNASAANTMVSSLANVSSNRAADGTWSLHFESNSADWNYYAGVLSPEYSGFDDAFELEFSFYPESNEDSDHLFQVFDLNDSGQLVGVVTLLFNWEGSVGLLDGEDLVEIAGNYPAGQWHDVRISKNATEHMIYLNGELLYTMPNYSTGSALKFFGIRYDNYGSGFSVDNIVASNEPLSTPDFEKNNFKHFVDANGLNLSADALISNVVVYNVSGQQLINQRLNATNGVVNTNSLSNGVYLAQVEIEGVTTTVKFIK